MTKSIHLILGAHNHQPVDNWDHVVEEAYQKSYQPFLDVLESHPSIRMGLHYTGYLLDWLAERHPTLIEQLRRLVERDQVEILTGGYYEPILALIPDADKLGQIRALSNRLRELTGREPRGMWLAERVWEPHLAKTIAEAGVEYLFLDDAHFHSVGLDDEELLGRYTTEELGRKVDIFPVQRRLRQQIPYAAPEEVVEHLLGLATEDGRRAGIYFDDGEKFGVWPGSYKLAYREKWLHRFFSVLEAHSDVIHTVTPGQYAERVPSLGRVYLPTASYGEMLDWALPSRHVAALSQGKAELAETYHRYLRGGFWRHFLVKYPEANNLHKKMLRVADKVRAAEAKTGLSQPEMLSELWQGQSNDVFWHGWFGGLYLTNLRTANYRHLLKAEAMADAILRGESFFEIQLHDFDCDGQPEVLLESHLQNLYFDPDGGGSLFELDFRPKAFNLLDTLARRHEAYHDRLSDSASKALHYDPHRRASLLDHFLGPDTTLEKLQQSRHEELGDFVAQPYAIDLENDRLVFERIGTVLDKGEPRRIQVRKALTFSRDAAETVIRYEITNLSDKPARLWFAPEFNVNFLAPDAPDRYYYVPGSNNERTKPKDAKLKSKGRLEAVPGIGMVDEWTGIDYCLTFNQPADVWRFSIETVSQSEAGFDKIYQCSVLHPNWKLVLAPDKTWAVEITQRISPNCGSGYS